MFGNYLETRELQFLDRIDIPSPDVEIELENAKRVMKSFVTAMMGKKVF